MLKPKLYRSCRVCGEQYRAWSSAQQLNRYCGPVCAAIWAQRKRDADRVKAERKKLAERKESLKTRNDWVKEAQQEFNRYIRERDYYKPCMACGTTSQSNSITGSSWDAGHYRSRGAAPGLRFHLLNVWKVCTRCNRELSGNVVEMRKGMVARLGVERVEDLEADNRLPKYTISDLKRIKTIFKRRANAYKRRRESRSQ